VILVLYLVSVFYFYTVLMLWTQQTHTHTHGNIVPLLLVSVGAEKGELAINVTGIFMQCFSLDCSPSSGVCYYFRSASLEYYYNL